MLIISLLNVRRHENAANPSLPRDRREPQRRCPNAAHFCRPEGAPVRYLACAVDRAAAARPCSEGLKHPALAELLDLQPISLPRLLDRLAESGLIERRPDPHDRRANRLYLTSAARPLLKQLAALGEDLMETVLQNVDAASQERLLRDLGIMKDNLRAAIQRNAGAGSIDRSATG